MPALRLATLTQLGAVMPISSRRAAACRSLAYELVKRGVIPSIRLGRRIVVPVIVLDELLASPSAS